MLATSAGSARLQDDGGYWDAITVADDLAELESRGRLRRQPAIDWGGGDLPEPRIEYVVVVDDEDT